MKQLKMIYSIVIEIPLFYLGYAFETIYSAFGAGRIAYYKKLMREDEVNEFLKWREGNKIK